MADIKQLVKTKQRVTDHGEVFTPTNIVNAMLDLVSEEASRIDSRFLEPACGEGNFLRQVLLRKLATVQSKYAKSEFERRHYALLALMCIYGIELLEDNASVCRANLLDIFVGFINDEEDEVWQNAAKQVLKVNIVQADALTMLRPDDTPLVFAEWAYLEKGRFQRRDFQYDILLQRSSFAGTLFGEADADVLFAPKTDYKPMTVRDIAALEAA